MTACLVFGSIYGKGTIHPVNKYGADPVDNIFIRAESSKPTVYVGESVIVKYLLYTSGSVIDPQTNADIKFINCYQEEYPIKAQQHIEKINGKIYNVVLLKQYLVIPSNDGKLLLPRLKIDVKVNAVAENDFFGQEKLISKQIYSKVASIEVNKLPALTGSASFSGATGTFKVLTSYIPSQQNSSLLFFKAIIDGIGNTKTINFASQVVPKGLDIYNAQTSHKDTLTQYGIKTQIVYTCQLVANYRGGYHVSPFTFVFFDPKSGQYKYHTSPAFYWDVKNGPVLSKPQTQHLYIKTDANSAAAWYDLDLFYFFVAVYTLVFIYSLKPSLYNSKISVFVNVLTAKRAKYGAINSIRKVKRRSPSFADDMFYRELLAIFYKYIQQKKSGFKMEEMFFETELLKLDLPVNTYNKVVAFLKSVQRSRFGTNSGQTTNTEILTDELLVVIKTFEDAQHR